MQAEWLYKEVQDRAQLLRRTEVVIDSLQDTLSRPEQETIFFILDSIQREWLKKLSMHEKKNLALQWLK
jgi:hypothetical protein